MKQWVINWILVVLSIVAILLAILKVTPFEVSEGTYIGVMITLLGLSVAILLGYQVYNAIELKGQLEQQRQTSEMLQKLYGDSESKRILQEAQMNEGFEILSALIEYNRGQSFIVCGNALLHMHGALVYSLDTDRTDFEWIFSYIRRYIAEMNSQTFASSLSEHSDGEWYIATVCEYTGKSLREYINLVFKNLFDDESQIRIHPNFSRIQIEYDRVMRLLHNRLDVIIKDPLTQLSPEEKNSIINPKY